MFQKDISVDFFRGDSSLGSSTYYIMINFLYSIFIYFILTVSLVGDGGVDLGMSEVVGLPPLPSRDPFTPSNAFTKPKFVSSHFSNGIAAIVENRVITVDEVQRKVAPFIPLIRREVQKEEAFGRRVEEIFHEALEGMIDEILLVNSFTSNKKLKIPQAYMDAHYNKTIDERFAGDRSLYNDYLKEQGISDRQFRERQKEEIIISVVRAEIHKAQPEVSPDKIQKYYDTHHDDFHQEEAVHLYQITLSPGEDVSGEEVNVGLLEEAQPIIDKLKRGDDFAALAKEYSQDAMKSSGGDWGWIKREDINPELAKVAFNLEKGEHSEPIILNNHAFILYVKDLKKAGLLPIEAVRERIEAIIVSDLANHALNDKIQKLRAKAHIRRFI